jgi:hypothetical protein
VATTSIVISIRGGSTDRAEVELVSGTPVEAFSVGTDGGWRVTGNGVVDVHAYLYFDGGTLFVASAAGATVRSGPANVGTDWMPLSVPSEVSLGQVTLEIRAGGAARPVPSSKPSAPRAPAQVHRPQPSARPVSKPVRPPGEVLARQSKPDLSVGTNDYDDSDAPTQYQPAPAGFLDAVGPSSPAPESATKVHPGKAEVGPVSEEATRVMQHDPSDLSETKTSTSSTTAPRPAAGQSSRQQPGVEYSPPRPPAPSIGGDGATVVRPLEEFLAAGGQPPVDGGMPDTAKRPLELPNAAGAMGVIISPPDPTRPPSDGMRWVGDPASPDAQLVPVQGTPVMPGYPPNPGMPQGNWPPQTALQAQNMFPQQPGMQQPGMQGQHPGMQGMQQPGMQQPGMQQPGMQQPGMPGAQPPWPGQQQGAWGQQYPQGWSGTQGQAPAATAGGSPVDKALAVWKAMPFPRKLLVILLPFGLIAFVVVFLPQQKAPRGKRPVASVSAKPSASAPVLAGTPPVPTPPPPTAPVSVEPPTPPPPASVGEPPPSNPPPSNPPPANPPPTEDADAGEPKLAKGESTLARKASDAIAVNDYPKALEAYQQLAKEHPENPAYAQAVSILRRKLAKK